MGAVAARLGDLPGALGDTRAFIRFIRDLHGLSLLGDGTSFYRPASRIADGGRVEPTRFLTEGAKTQKTPGGVRILSGARVNASPIGGAEYQALLAESLGDPESLSPVREAVEDGLSWGRVVTSRAAADDDEKPWFCPPRPLEERHFDALRGHLVHAVKAAEKKRSNDLSAELAAFHRRFVRLHPFRCGNQSLAMSVVNHFLRSAHGFGIPHLVLDHLALRLSPVAYERAFRIAVEAWLSRGSSVARYTELADKKRRVYAFVRALSAATTVDDAWSLARANPKDARLAFIAV
jgi:hypothetical protein